VRILFFTHYYPPEVNAPASRTSEHCKQWVKDGHEVVVVTSVPNHPKGVVYPGYVNRLFQREIVDGVSVVRVWTFLAANEGFLRRTLNYVTFLFSAILAMPRLSRPDVVVSTSPQFFCGLTGLFAKLSLRVPWVLEIRDLWPESIVAVGAMRKNILTRGLEWLERLAYRKADRIVSVTDSFVPHIAARCQDVHKIDVIKNGVDLSLFNDRADPLIIKNRFLINRTFIAAYIGTHGMAHGLDVVLDAAHLLRHEPRIGFLMVGDGAERERLAARVIDMALDNVFIVGQLPKSDMPSVWAATNASLILLRKSDAFTKVLPSKMFEAMAMRCPIILGVEGEAKALLTAARAGIAIEPESADALASVITRLASDPTLCRTLGQSGATFVAENFDRTVLARRYIGVLERAVAGRVGNVRASSKPNHDSVAS
jgi:glycosyltransferase involved in cell wall biosynthesis